MPALLTNTSVTCLPSLQCSVHRSGVGHIEGDHFCLAACGDDLGLDGGGRFNV